MLRVEARRGLVLSSTLVLAIAHSALGSELPPPVTAKSAIRIWVDQIGYRTSGPKLAIVASDKPLPPLAQLSLEVRDAKSLKTVWASKDHPNALRLFNNGQKDGESGDFVAHLNLGDLKTPGRYFVVVRGRSEGDLKEPEERSYCFNVADGVYKDSGIAAWRAFYYNRADTDLPEKFAGLWNHKLDHCGPGQAKDAHVYKWTGRPHWEPVGKDIADPTPRDVRGGWWDAGNFDKYMGNTTATHNDLLLAVQLLGDAAKDGQLNLPESGNGAPDMLDEVRYATEFILRMADETGAAFGRAFEGTACPPESDTKPVMLTQVASGATMNRACALAYASLVWKERNADAAFVRKCMDESLKSWSLLEKKPHPWPADPKDPKKPAPTGEWFFVNYDQSRALAAACYFKATGDAKYDAIVRECFAKWNAIPPGEERELYPTLWLYTHSKGADPDLVKKMKAMVFAGADAIVAKQTGSARGYAAGIRGYWWGSNRLIGSTGLHCILAAELADDPAARPRYLDAAEEFVHYLHGRNPIGLCFLTHMKQFGAEHSAMVMFHAWLGNINSPASAQYIGEGPGKIGPPPGYVVGGVNGGMKRYINDLDWRKSPWEFNEPCISYQGPCTALLGYFALKVR